jgi:hypothetical protein
MELDKLKMLKINAMVNWISALVAPSYQDKKPSINFAINQRNLLLA